MKLQNENQINPCFKSCKIQGSNRERFLKIEGKKGRGFCSKFSTYMIYLKKFKNEVDVTEKMQGRRWRPCRYNISKGCLCVIVLLF